MTLQHSTLIEPSIVAIHYNVYDDDIFIVLGFQRLDSTLCYHHKTFRAINYSSIIVFLHSIPTRYTHHIQPSSSFPLLQTTKTCANLPLVSPLKHVPLLRTPSLSIPTMPILLQVVLDPPNQWSSRLPPSRILGLLLQRNLLLEQRFKEVCFVWSSYTDHVIVLCHNTYESPSSFSTLQHPSTNLDSVSLIPKYSSHNQSRTTKAN
jgi:hypothetical protein